MNPLRPHAVLIYTFCVQRDRNWTLKREWSGLNCRESRHHLNQHLNLKCFSVRQKMRRWVSPWEPEVVAKRGTWKKESNHILPPWPIFKKIFKIKGHWPYPDTHTGTPVVRLWCRNPSLNCFSYVITIWSYCTHLWVSEGTSHPHFPSRPIIVHSWHTSVRLCLTTHGLCF